VSLVNLALWGLGIALIAVSVVLGTMNGGFEWTDYHSSTSRSSGGTGLSYEGSGVVFGLIFLIGPLGFGYALYARSGDLLYLNGTELTVVKRTRAMRFAHETRALEAVMRLSANTAIQHAAGQLRTVLRWTRLPVIHDAAPDAIPESAFRVGDRSSP